MRSFITGSVKLFNVDIITNTSFLKNSRFIANYCQSDDFVATLTEANLDGYDFIVLSDDTTLQIIFDSNLPIAKKLHKAKPYSSVMTAMVAAIVAKVTAPWCCAGLMNCGKNAM